MYAVDGEMIGVVNLEVMIDIYRSPSNIFYRRRLIKVMLQKNRKETRGNGTDTWLLAVERGTMRINEAAPLYTVKET